MKSKSGNVVENQPKNGENDGNQPDYDNGDSLVYDEGDDGYNLSSPENADENTKNDQQGNENEDYLNDDYPENYDGRKQRNQNSVENIGPMTPVDNRSNNTNSFLGGNDDANKATP